RRPPPTAIHPPPLHDALPISAAEAARGVAAEDLDASAEVSAVADVPILGGPRSARASVSAQDRRPQIPDEEVFDETVISSRHRPDRKSTRLNSSHVKISYAVF